MCVGTQQKGDLPRAFAHQWLLGVVRCSVGTETLALLKQIGWSAGLHKLHCLVAP